MLAELPLYVLEKEAPELYKMTEEDAVEVGPFTVSPGPGTQCLHFGGSGREGGLWAAGGWPGRAGKTAVCRGLLLGLVCRNLVLLAVKLKPYSCRCVGWQRRL